MKSVPILALLCLGCSTASAQAVAYAPRRTQFGAAEDLVTRAFQISHCRGIENGTEGQILRRLLTPKVGVFEYFAGSRILVVKDTKPVIESFAALVRHFDKAPTLDLVTRAFPIRYCRDQVSEPHGSLFLALRRILTPRVGRVEYDAKNDSLTVKDVKAVVDEVASILKHVDVEPLQVFLNVQFVMSQKGNLWQGSIAPSAGATKNGIGTLTPSEAAVVMQTIRKETTTRIVQAPKLVALDHRETSIVVGSSVPDENRTTPNFEVTLVPHIIPNTEKLIVDVRHGETVKQMLVKSGQTIVYRYFDAAEREVVVFVTPRQIQGTQEIANDLRKRLEKRNAKAEEERRRVPGTSKPAARPGR